MRRSWLAAVSHSHSRGFPSEAPHVAYGLGHSPRPPMSPQLPQLARRHWLALSIVVIALAGFVAFWLSLPSIDGLAAYRPPLPSVVLDRHGKPIGTFVEERRQLVQLKDVPQVVRDAFLSAEDDAFYSHIGFDPLAMARATLANLREGRVVQGGSTITQQLAKNLFLTSDRSFVRKLQDIALAARIEWALEKDEILELYLNQIYLGSGAYGVAEAALTYYGKPLAKLSVSEAAQLAALPKAPSRFSPHANPEAAEAGRKLVIARMRETGRLDAAAADAALADKPVVLSPPPAPAAYAEAAYFVEEVRQQLFDDLGAETVLRGGLRIETTLNLRMQRAALAAVEKGLAAAEQRAKRAGKEAIPEGALLAIDARTGDVLAMVGGRNFSKSRFNRAVQARRQPGSAFKPFCYGAALEAGYPPNVTLYDYQYEHRDKATGKLWRPKNYTNRFKGPVIMSEAFARSLNNATIRLVDEVGVDATIDFARRAGIRSPLGRDLGIALGTNEVTLLEITGAYATFARGGKQRDPRFVLRVRDAEGSLLRENLRSAELPEAKTAGRISEVDAYLMTYLMRETVRAWYGTAHAAAKLGENLAGKTGSTNDNRDAWFIGFTPQVVAGVWVGNDDRTPMARDQTGSGAALPIWTAFMEDVLREEPVSEFRAPPGLAWAGADPETGARVISSVQYPGWVPVAGDRELRRAKFVPSPYKQKEPEADATAIAAGDASAAGAASGPVVAEESPAASVFEALMPDVGAGPPADPAPPAPEASP
jgi:penicillin-binding protein 1A